MGSPLAVVSESAGSSAATRARCVIDALVHRWMSRLGHDAGVDLAAYEGVRGRVEVLASGLDPDARVPGCPSWRVRDVVAHLAGLCEDWVTGRLDGYASDEWTAAQVVRFEGRSVEEILARWRVAAGEFARLDPDPDMGPPARWAYGDAVSHEADLRGVTAASRVPDAEVAVALKGAISRWRQVLEATPAPPLLVRMPDVREYWLGRRDDPNAVVVDADGYEVFRALAGRRSRNQISRWAWSADPSVYLDAGPAAPFSWAAHDLID
jgi:hypothetical protein